MRINFKKLSPLPGLQISRPEVSFPYFLPLSPYGLGTGSVEALSSYLCRQATEIMEMSHPYGRRLLSMYADPGSLPKTEKFPAKGLHNCNGIGKVAARYAAATNTASKGAVDAYYLTLQPLTPLCDTAARGVHRQYLAWCDECWQEDVQLERTPYLRLYWLLQATKICVQHNRRLSEYCPACGEIQLQYPFYPRQWLCDKCGFELYRNEDDSAAENFTPEQGWASHSLFRVIERIYSDRLKLDEYCVVRSLKRIMSTAKLSSTEFANRLSLDHKMIVKLVTGQVKPFFPNVLELCYRLDVPLDQFILDRDILTSPEMWKDLARPKFYAGSRIPEKKKEQIRKKLQRLLQENPTPPARVSHLAAEFGISYTGLSLAFPVEYQQLRSRCLKWEQKQRNSAHTDLLQNMADAAFSLARHGIYPSDRKLRQLKLVEPYDLRRDDVITILRAIQEVYANLDLSS
jgi:AraC-like DNA-binding protein/DNA-binding Xre family transcriptional regulator